MVRNSSGQLGWYALMITGRDFGARSNSVIAPSTPRAGVRCWAACSSDAKELVELDRGSLEPEHLERKALIELF
jgi:hypothetical protein